MADKKITYADKPWLKSYQIGPFKLKPTMKPYPEINIYQFLEDSASKYPDNVAVVYAGDEMTYMELKLKVDKLASALVDFGIKKGDMVASVLPSCPEFILIHFATLKIGAIHVPLSILHKAPDLEYELKESGAEVVLCSYRRLERLNEVKPNTKVKTIIYTPTKLFPDYDLPDVEKPTEDGYYLLSDLLEKFKPHKEQVDINPHDDLAVLSFTGGTTGLPKATMLTHYNITSNVIQLFHWMMDPLKSGIIGKAAITICVPLFHAYGQISMHVCVSWGLKMLLMDPRDMVNIAGTIKKIRPFMVLGVPTHYMYLVKLDIPKAPIFYISGAAPLPPELSDEFSKKTGVPMSEGYGATETSANTHINLSAVSKVTGFMASTKTGIGVPVADTEVKLVDPDTGEEVPFGEPGEVWIRGPQIMKGYYPTPGKGLTEDGWLKMGDIGIMDEDGYFKIVDRIKEMINVSGNKVYSRVYEDMLYEHPAVSEAAIIGIPDPERLGSERVKAFIQLKPGYKGKITEDEIIAYCREKFKPYAVPRAVEFRETLPLTLAMKIFKRKLKDEELAKMKAEGIIK
ncbi:MAG: AMP-binding protein [Candidatus Hermodarchaeota archaeon]